MAMGSSFVPLKVAELYPCHVIGILTRRGGKMKEERRGDWKVESGGRLRQNDIPMV
jgi:hypothetical protein